MLYRGFINRLLTMFLLTPLFFSYLYSQSPYTNAYLDTVLYIYDNCRCDTIIFNNCKQNYDTIKDCRYYMQMVYKNIDTGSIFRKEKTLLGTGKYINNEKYGSWFIRYKNNTNDIHGWKLVIADGLDYYFKNTELCRADLLTNFSLSPCHDTVTAIVDYYSFLCNSNIYKVVLECYKNNENQYVCRLKTEYDDTISIVPMAHCEDEVLLLISGVYDRKIHALYNQKE